MNHVPFKLKSGIYFITKRFQILSIKNSLYQILQPLIIKKKNFATAHESIVLIHFLPI